MNATILLLEDDQQLSDTVKEFLEYHEYRVMCAYDGLQAEEIAYENKIDLMLLDVKVPYLNGFDFLKKMRVNDVKIPAIFITSLNSVKDLTHGFDIGCDDYMKKPFSLKELLVRVQFLLKRRYGTYRDKILLSEGLEFDTQESLLTHKNKIVPLKKKEAKLLALFLEHPNELLRYEKMFDTLWGYEEEPSLGSLRAYIQKVRTFLGKKNIETIKNVGYRFVKE